MERINIFNLFKKKEPKTFKFKNGLYRFKEDITLFKSGIMINIEKGSKFRVEQFEPTLFDEFLYKLSVAGRSSNQTNVSFLVTGQTLLDSAEYIEPDVKLNCD